MNARGNATPGIFVQLALCGFCIQKVMKRRLDSAIYR